MEGWEPLLEASGRYLRGEQTEALAHEITSLALQLPAETVTAQLQQLQSPVDFLESRCGMLRGWHCRGGMVPIQCTVTP